jgi:hypothetical protein
VVARNFISASKLDETRQYAQQIHLPGFRLMMWVTLAAASLMALLKAPARRR